MTTALKFLLSLHVVTGLLGIIAFAAVGLWLMRQILPLRSLRWASAWGVLFLILSWLSGGYYYATYYGKAVRDVIKKGPYPWAHTIFMEAKEHVFLFLPFLGLVVGVVIFTLGPRLESNPSLKKTLSVLTGILMALGIMITLAGAVISGGVR